MNFPITSPLFICLILAVLPLYYKLGSKGQRNTLLILSVLFYLVNCSYISLCVLFPSVIIVFIFTKNKNFSGIYFIPIILFGTLCIIKYIGLEKIIGEASYSLIVPLAISYYTLSLATYFYDCRWGLIKPYENICDLILFTMYFPLMTSGPICKYSDIGEQLISRHEFAYIDVRNGLIRFMYGLIKKVAIANRLAVLVNDMYSSSASNGGGIWLATGLFALQLYTDFSGIMDIACGISICFGIKLPENFKAPFLSENTREFWQRWHITLGLWLRDYVMFPFLHSKICINLSEYLQNKIGKKASKRFITYLGLLILWLCMGIWHGSGSFKYVIGEGLWFWIVIVIGDLIGVYGNVNKSKFFTIFRRLRTFFIFVIGMIFFRSDSLQDALNRLYNGIFNINDVSGLNGFFNAMRLSIIGGPFGLMLILISMIALIIVDIRIYSGKNSDCIIEELLMKRKPFIRWFIYVFGMMIVIMSYNASASVTLYGQF